MPEFIYINAKGEPVARGLDAVTRLSVEDAKNRGIDTDAALALVKSPAVPDRPRPDEDPAVFAETRANNAAADEELKQTQAEEAVMAARGAAAVVPVAAVTPAVSEMPVSDRQDKVEPITSVTAEAVKPHQKPEKSSK